MENRDFVYWLKGFFELSGADKLDAYQTQIIKDHLDLCFKKQTPDYWTVIADIPNNQTC